VARLLNVGERVAAAGFVSGNFALAIPLDTLDQPGTYRLHGAAHARRVRLAEAADLEDVNVQVVCRDGLLSVPQLDAKLCGTPIRAQGQAALAPPYRYGVTLQAGPSAGPTTLPAELGGVVEADGRVQGTLQPPKLDGSGKLAVKALTFREQPLGE